MAHDVDSDGQ